MKNKAWVAIGLILLLVLLAVGVWYFTGTNVSDDILSSNETVDMTTNQTQWENCPALVQEYLANADMEGNGGQLVANGDTVSVEYIGRLADGSVFDTSIESIARECGVYTEVRDYSTLLSFTVGGGQMIAGFDQAVQGMSIGQTQTVTIPAAEAYGQWSEENLFPVDKSTVPDADNYSKGQSIVAQYGQQFVVYEVTEDEIIFDANHPLAGKDLIFDITVKSIE
jgi:FKBP-type peptidyl-prolyl cis-trans isomerase 2